MCKDHSLTTSTSLISRNHSTLCFWLMIKLRLSMILKTSKKNVWSNDFWFVKQYIFWEFIQYNTHWDKTQMLKRIIPLGKLNVTKKAFFFLSRALTHHSFIFNSRFFSKLQQKVLLSKSVCGISHFWFPFGFY